MVAVPTALTNDGMASPVVSLAGADGVRRSMAAGMPSGVVIDLDVVGEAPDRYVRAGIGDLVSNLTAVCDWRLASARTDEPFDEFAASIALQSAGPVLDLQWPLGPEDLTVVARGLVMSGLAMEAAGSSRPCSGAEHLISHALDQLLGADARLHGEQVAMASVITAGWHGLHAGRLAALFQRCGIPATPTELGIDEPTIVEAIRAAPATRPGRFTILDTIDLSPDALVAHIRGTLSAAKP